MPAQGVGVGDILSQCDGVCIMKQNPNFLLREVADSLVLVPVGEATKKYPGMITLNATGKFLWEALAAEQTAES